MSLLPQHEGYLPYFLLYASSAAIIHSFVCYISPPNIAMGQFKGPARPEPNGLASRIYAMKNVYTSLIRGYAAYHITNTEVYNLAMLTFVGVLWLYGTELFYYRTARAKESIISLITATTGIIWMNTQREFYSF
ncbi:hypothetical protein B0T25DRAFT_191553 [Lasiosphaeria hispida]|uniref:Ergosterol biosynthesis protein n=1 Tax=Lasiosphaeria hispida TaxID=260671 RepID=A0AAJ0MDR5_9PEZI|nr:hypothetical protein B0T25DRAFT_191553 [Lasiosphaeria hispida]